MADTYFLVGLVVVSGIIKIDNSVNGELSNPTHGELKIYSPFMV